MARTKMYANFSGKGDIEYKKDFLQRMKDEKYEERYIMNVESKLKKFGEFEDEFGKDVYSFIPDELDSMLYGMQMGTVGNARFIRSILIKYTEYAKSQNKGNLSLNVEELLSGEKIEQYVSKVKMEGKTITEEELKNIIDGLKNARDKAIMWLLWLGVAGKNFSNLRKLKKTDVLWDNNAIVLVDEDSNSERIIENIPDEIMKILEKAKDENEYYATGQKTRTLIDDIYLIKAYDINRKVNTRNYMSKGSFLCFFTNLKKFKQFGDKAYITAKNIYRSGMLYNFDKYLKEHNLEANKKTFTDFRDKYYQEVPTTFYYDFLKTFEQAITTEES